MRLILGKFVWENLVAPKHKRKTTHFAALSSDLLSDMSQGGLSTSHPSALETRAKPELNLSLWNARNPRWPHSLRDMAWILYLWQTSGSLSKSSRVTPPSMHPGGPRCSSETSDCWGGFKGHFPESCPEDIFPANRGQCHTTLSQDLSCPSKVEDQYRSNAYIKKILQLPCRR